jgi:hypothetical protein
VNRGSVYFISTGESVEPPLVSRTVIPGKAGIQEPPGFQQLPEPRFRRGDEKFTSSRAFRIAVAKKEPP